MHPGGIEPPSKAPQALILSIKLWVLEATIVPREISLFLWKYRLIVPLFLKITDRTMKDMASARALSRGIGSILLLFFGWLFCSHFSHQVYSVSQDVRISEVQIAGNMGANDEFVELYNSSSVPINLTGWRLSKQSSSASASAQILVASLSGSIAGKGFYLIAHPNFSGAITPDRFYSATSSGGIAANNTVLLYSDAGKTLVDLVGMGTAQTYETASTHVPGTGQSIERKACSSSTASTLAAGGDDESSGNALDTDVNSTDFVLQSIPVPQNSSSLTEESVCGSLQIPTPTSTPQPTASPTPSPTPLPTETPLPTATPISTPGVIPTPSPSPLPTVIPTPAPSTTPLPTTSPTPSPSVSPTPSSTPLPTATPTTFPSATPQPSKPPKAHDRHHEYTIHIHFFRHRYSCGVRFEDNREKKLFSFIPKIILRRQDE